MYPLKWQYFYRSVLWSKRLGELMDKASVEKWHRVFLNKKLLKKCPMKKEVFSFNTAIFCVLISIPQAKAQWSSMGPYGGPMYAVETSGSTVYAGTGLNGVFKSSDNGQTWAAANSGLEGRWINALATSSNYIYAGTNYDGVFVSSNDGATWLKKSNGLTDLHIESLFTTGTGVYAATSDGVFFSANNGNVWTLDNTGIPGTYNVYSWAQMGDTIFAGTYGAGLYMKTLTGSTWTQVSGGLPVSTTSSYFYALTTDGNNIYAGTNSGIYKSTDRGVTWTQSNAGFPSGIFAVSFAVKAGYIFAGTTSAGVYVSTNGGTSWTVARTGMEDWPGSNMGPNYSYGRVNDMAVSGSQVLAASFDAMYRSPDNAANWVVSQEGILATRITGVSSNGSTIIAGENNTGMYVSTDGGANWSRANNGLTAAGVLAVTMKGTTAFTSIQNKKVYRSTNNGATWTSASNGLTADVLLFAANSTKLYAITAGGKFYNQKLFVTTDDGNNWSEVIGSNAISGGMTAIALRDNYIYIGTGNGMLLRSGDNGDSWTDIGSYLPSVKITAILSTDEATYVGTEGKGIFKITEDNYSTQTSMNVGLTSTNITDLEMSNDILFASTWGGGVFASAMGNRWFTTNGPGNMFVRQMTPANNKLYAGTEAGVYQTDDDDFARFAMLTGISKTKQNSEFSFYPNPASSNITFDLKDKSGHIIIYDITGKIVLDQTITRTGSIDVSSLPRGVYVIKTQASQQTLVNKLVIE
jgi:hypothetical protein